MNEASAATAEGDHAIEVAERTVRLMPERAAFCESTRSLLIADTHLGKSETFRAAGAPLPAGDADEQLRRLSRAIERAEARRVIVVGDLLHAPAGLRDSLIQRVEAWRHATPIDLVVIPGNHDRRLDRVAAPWRLDVQDDGWTDGAFAYCHDPAKIAESSRPFTWCGHVHPAVRLRSGIERLKLPAFVVGATRAVLPAFSRFTGGVTARPGPGDRLYAIAGSSVVAAPA